MKLQIELLSLLSIIWITFIGLATTTFIQASLVNFSILTIIFLCLSLLLLSHFIFNRITELNQKVIDIAATHNHQTVDLKQNDEISSLENKVNLIAQSVKENKSKLEKEEERATLLKNANFELHQQLIDSFSQVTKENERSETLTRLAHYDNLTALPNHVFFNEILNKTINHAKRRNKIFAVLMIDIDDFKKINTTVGAAAGDQILKELGVRFSNTLRAEDILARLTGDEFIVLLSDIAKPKFASTVAEKLLQAAARPLKIKGETISLKTSIGISIYPNDGNALEELLKNTSIALEKVKHSGGNGYQFYTEELDTEGHEFKQLESALRKALQNKELVLYYQPRLQIKAGNISGVEALIRWINPELGTVNPAKLIGLAEETGLSMQIGEWALAEACRMNKFWQDEGYEHISVAVNLSPRQFQHPDLIRIINQVLTETNLNPKYLELEINESTIMDDIDLAAEVLDKLKSTGVLITIDHFGVGYTSISYLKKLPISILKIDRNFIKGIPHNSNDLAITNALISLAHNLGMEVIAEGVETAEQVQYLSMQNCDMIQGYFLSHPLPPQKIMTQFTKLNEDVLL